VGENDDAVRKNPIQDGHLLKVLGGFQQPAVSPAKELHGFELCGEVLVVRCLIVGLVVVAPLRHMGERLEQHGGEIVGEQLNLFVDMIGCHLVHEREMRHQQVDHADGDVHPGATRVRLDTCLRRQGKGLVAFPVRHGAEGGSGGQQIVKMGGAGAGQSRDHHGRPQFDVVDLRVPATQVGQQQPVLEQLQHLPVEVDQPGSVHSVDVAQRRQVDIESFPVLAGTEIM
jgi:hypothetical protein